jgi:hypothetical protein
VIGREWVSATQIWFGNAHLGCRDNNHNRLLWLCQDVPLIVFFCPEIAVYKEKFNQNLHFYLKNNLRESQHLLRAREELVVNGRKAF